MPSIDDYVDEIDKWRDTLAYNLTKIGISSSMDEKLNTLVPKVLDAGSGVSVLNGIMCPTFSGNLSVVTGMQVLNGTATLEE